MKTIMKKILLLLILTGCTFVAITNYMVVGYGEYTKSDLSLLPQEHACLVLGTSKTLSSGSANLFYEYRINAAYEVYSSGKCKKIVVSGDNRHSNYNEPEEMKRSLISKGVLASEIFCDYAGGRTLDSVIRFKEIFGQSSGIVVSQEFHNERAIYIADHNGIKLVGYNAKEVGAFNAFKTKTREIASKSVAVINVIINTKPRHLGEKVPI